MIEYWVSKARFELRSLGKRDPAFDQAMGRAKLREEVRDGVEGFVFDPDHPDLVAIRGRRYEARPTIAVMSGCQKAAAKIWGPPLWGNIHGKRNLTPADIEQFKSEIPCPGCLADFEQGLIEIPPDYSSDAASFACTWRWHDRVSQKIGNPRITLEEAIRLHRPERLQ